MVFGFEGMTFKSRFRQGKAEGFSESRRSLTIFLDSSMVEHSAVNRVVVGSSPTRGAKTAELLKRRRKNKAPWSSG